MLQIVKDLWYYYIVNLRKHESRLKKYQGYGQRNILEFRRRNGLDWNFVRAILETLVVLDGLTLRNFIRETIEQESVLFGDPTTYFSHFGPLGKSGAAILNQFNRSCSGTMSDRIVSTHELSKLPSNSKIVFVDDFIGTGLQALDYIQSLNYALNPSIQLFLFSIAGTVPGIEYIAKARTRFKVICPFRLSEADYFLLHPDCSKLDESQKTIVRQLNTMLLTGLGEATVNLNIPFALFYSIPDNALPALWKDAIPYTDGAGHDQEWYGLLPRDF